MVFFFNDKLERMKAALENKTKVHRDGSLIYFNFSVLWYVNSFSKGGYNLHKKMLAINFWREKLIDNESHNALRDFWSF